MKRLCLWVVLLAGLLVAGPLAATAAPDPQLSLDRLFSSPEFRGERFGRAHWLTDGSAYTMLEPSKTVKNGSDIVRYDPESGRRDVMVPAEKLIPADTQKPLKVAEYSWSTDGGKLLIFTNTKRVWRRNTRGDYWVLDRTSGSLQKLGGDNPEPDLMFAKFSSDGGRVAYVRRNDLYVEDLGTHRIIRLTVDGSPTLANGTSDWVYEEELAVRDGFRWSPDGRSIAYWQIDSSGEGEYTLLNTTDSLYPKIKRIPYPKVGTTNPAARLGIVPAAGGATTWVKLDGDPRDYYIARMEWADSSKEIIFQRLNRLQNTLTLMMADARTGTARTVLTDRDKAWVEVVDDLQWLDNGKQFLWVSESDGWRHVYLVPREGGTLRLITPGDFDVIRVAGIDAPGGWLYYIASPDNPGQRYLYRMPLDGSGQAERLSPADQPGTHSYTLAPGCRWAFHTFSDFNTPPVTDLVHLPDHRVVRTLVDNAELKKKVAALRISPGRFFRVDIGDGVQLDGWCIQPYDFNPARRYPVLFYVYGEPAGQTVLDRWSGTRYLWHQMLAQHGYLVMSVDNRGTPAPRGREWRKCIYRQVGILASADQAAALRAILRRWDYVDPNRVGIWGWSGGGSMTLNMMFRYPELYHTGMAVAFVANQKFYDSIYQERYMGLPADNEAGYRDGSPITWAHQLKGNLLLVHGTGDDNVHYQNSEVLINELVRLDKPFTMMAYPNRSHGIYEGKGTTRHLYGLLTRYLEANLPAAAEAR